MSDLIGYSSNELDLMAKIERLTQELQYAKDDLKHLEGACWYCLNHDIEDPWRHVHEPKGGHWHHCIDPGDGLPSDCKNTDRLERVFQELTAMLKVAEDALTRYADDANWRTYMGSLVPHKYWIGRAGHGEVAKNALAEIAKLREGGE